MQPAWAMTWTRSSGRSGQCRRHLAASVCAIRRAVFAFLRKMVIFRLDDAGDSEASLRLDLLRPQRENGKLSECVEPRDRIFLA